MRCSAEQFRDEVDADDAGKQSQGDRDTVIELAVSNLELGIAESLIAIDAADLFFWNWADVPRRRRIGRLTERQDFIVALVVARHCLPSKERDAPVENYTTLIVGYVSNENRSRVA